ncbi:hypothetical protein U9M48_027505 [Paspalum notatum var. saurae]|uniref:Reverse transcriptase Ty1/copia-type domain-containing protein n=1 Tax=Paspalum notatum var. saurae TaxID=547442 RepID=A0AAQ3TYZ2_PASNO
MAIPQDSASNKRSKRKKSSKKVDASQPHVEKPSVKVQLSHPTSTVHSITDVGTSEHIVLGNNEPSIWVHEISTNYLDSRESYDRKTTVVDIYFSASIAENLQNDPDPKTMAECKTRLDWIQWKEAIQAELASLTKRGAFTYAIPTPPRVFPVGFKWVFVRKQNENNEAVRYKARLVAQGFTQRLGIDFNETYSPVMSGITFRYLISLAIQNHLSMQLMDVVTADLYGSLDSDIYMKATKRNMYCVKLQKSLYGLKQSGRMWYNRLSEFLLQKGYTNNDDCPFVFVKKSRTGFCIISVYVDDLNMIGNPQDEARNHLKTEFEMKDLGKTKFCLGILVHQSAYVQKILEKFNMDKSYPSKIPMVVRSLNMEKDPFRSKDDGEEILGPEFPYLSAIGAHMYLANYTRRNIAFAVNLLARHSAAPTKRHWTGVKYILRYINGTRDLGLFFQPNKDPSLIGYTDVGYLSDPHSTAILWKSSKQTLVATSTNHSKIIALYEASRECVWLRRMINHIQQSCGFLED